MNWELADAGDIRFNTDTQTFEIYDGKSWIECDRAGLRDTPILTEKEIALDDFQNETINKMIEMGRQYLEELYASDENYFNKLLEKLESSQNQTELTYIE